MAKKRFDYFNYFKEVSEIICEGAAYLNTALHEFDADSLQQKLDALHEIEHRADCARHEMTAMLAHEFITPIEREDIVSLAQQMDTVVDYIEDVLLRIYMFNIKEIRSEAILFADSIIKCAKELDAVLAEFKNFKHSQTIREKIVAVNNCESEGDKILVDGIRKLSVSDATDRELFAWTDIYEHLELCLDACEDVVDIIESVIMKNT